MSTPGTAGSGAGPGGRRSRLPVNRLRDRIRRAAAEGEPPEAVVQGFFDRQDFPVVEGLRCTFAVRVADADAVTLRHRVVGLADPLALRRLAGTDVWYVVVEIPPDSRVEYQFEVRRGESHERFNDPGNPHQARGPFGSSSVLHSAGYTTPAWAVPDPDARPGELVETWVRSTAQRRDNRVTLYLPARFRRSARYPLLVVHDGGDYLEYAAMKTVLDNLIHRLDVAETVVAFTHPGDRLVEYPNSSAHARWVATELLGHLEQELPLAPGPAARALMGSSFGAVAALSTAVRHPGTFGSLLLQSGSFVFTDIGADHGEDKAFDPVVRFVNRYRARPTRVADRLFVSCGVYEDLIVANRSMVPVFGATGMDVEYVESRDGHNWESWRDRLQDGLSWVLPGEAMFVYE
ncbi:enterochelin esterase [Friedmanniella luteola]|uniref:Enterochelin esterase n=1 Tax=Friedmanniella luteola TaxID=546871 RepID=A0A1H2AD09_9ACTN|nr:alpha/beta hydrolase-fold protein [Friedmanniella luteola]SDT43885.1 enterochelin esterase [Friedmanniella luteola]